MIRDQVQIERLYQSWLEQVTDKTLTQELKSIADDDTQIRERFYTDLAFGTGGLRGILGAGTNRMNVYTVAKTTLAFGQYLNSLKTKNRKSVAIAFDTRNNSFLFAHTAAKVLAGCGIASYLCSEPTPTPVLSYAVRYFGCDGGICITASHNPAEYNGYKVYGSDGGQLTSFSADKISELISTLDDFSPYENAQSGYDASLITAPDEGMIKSFFESIFALRPEKGRNDDNLNIVYTPLNGAGMKYISHLFKMINVKNVQFVESQSMPNGNFPTCPYPNPEDPSALIEGLSLCEKLGSDLLIATDPDSDRIAVCVKTREGIKSIGGNELGLLLADYLLSERKRLGTLCAKPKLITTIVSTELVDPICKEYNVEVIRTLTGFKYIGEKITELEESGAQKDFVFGFEESCGYMIGDHVRDKDAVGTAMIVCDMASRAKDEGLTLLDKLDKIYKKYGYYQSRSVSFAFSGEDGMLKMNEIMGSLRANPPQSLNGAMLYEMKDYSRGINGLPPSNVLEFKFSNQTKIIIRPSGTEPKIKAYLFCRGEGECTKNMEKLEEAADKLIKGA